MHFISAPRGYSFLTTHEQIQFLTYLEGKKNSQPYRVISARMSVGET